MPDIVLRAENLGKRYRIGEASYGMLRETVAKMVLAPFHGTRLRGFRDGPQLPLTESAVQAAAHRVEVDPEGFVWALRNVSFEVKAGEVIGIIGRNGAGKSTLLKILSRITAPTEGRAEIHGRVGSMLEVGTGFHPELTGRENVYLSGAIIGMKRAEIDQKYEEIVAFAEVDRFIDTPVKHYSSGMHARLGFAVAAHLEPDILLVDEVLAVGDAAFTKKCLGRMDEISKEGRTVLFVSHNMGAINTLTRKCIYLRDGQIITYGDTRHVVDRYLADTFEKRKNVMSEIDFFRRNRIADTPISFTRIWVNEPSSELPVIELGSKFSIFAEMQAVRKIEGANLTVIIKDLNGHRILVLFSWDQDFSLFLAPGGHIVELEVEGLPLVPGRYVADIGVNRSTGTTAYDVLIDVPLFEVVNRGQVTQWPDRPWGSVHWRKVEWKLPEALEVPRSGDEREPGF